MGLNLKTAAEELTIVVKPCKNLEKIETVFCSPLCSLAHSRSRSFNPSARTGMHKILCCPFDKLVPGQLQDFLAPTCGPKIIIIAFQSQAPLPAILPSGFLRSHSRLTQSPGNCLPDNERQRRIFTFESTCQKQAHLLLHTCMESLFHPSGSTQCGSRQHHATHHGRQQPLCASHGLHLVNN